MQLYNPREKSLFFCGKERYFNNIPAKKLLQLTKPAEKLMKELNEKTLALSEIQLKAQNKRVEANDMLARRDRMHFLSDKFLSTKEIKPEFLEKAEKYINTAEKLKKDSQKLIQEAEKIEEPLEGMNKELNSFIDDMNKTLEIEYGKICSEVFKDFKPEDFNEHTSIDMIIAQNLIEFQDKILSGELENRLQLRLKQLIHAKYGTSDSFQQQE